MREHKAAGCRDRKGGGGEPPAGSRKWQGRGRADHRLMGKVIQIAGNWIWHMYNSVCRLKVDTLELFPTQLFPAQHSSEITDLHVNADAWPPLQIHPRSWLPVSGWPGQGDLRLALWGTWPSILRCWGRQVPRTSPLALLPACHGRCWRRSAGCEPRLISLGDRACCSFIPAPHLLAVTFPCLRYSRSHVQVKLTTAS